MSEPISDQLADSVTQRGINLQRYNASLRRKVLAMLRRLEKELVDDLNSTDPAGVTANRYRQQRTESLLKQTRESIRTAYKEIRDLTKLELKELAAIESDFTLRMLNETIGFQVATVALSKAQLTTLATTDLIQGARTEEWWSRQAATLQKRFGDKVRSGMLRGKSTPEIVRDVRGTKAANYKNGIMKTTRREAESLVRSSVQHVANKSREEVYKQNTDVVKAIQWIATLDNRTTIICMGLNGKQWSVETNEPIGHANIYPGPTAHINCRSTQIPVLKSWQELAGDGVVIGGRRKNFESEFRRQLQKQGVSKANAAKTMANTRSSMDGQVSRTLTFDDWLKKQSIGRQDQLLGKTRATMFREGKIGLSDLIDQSNRPLTLDELAKIV